MPDLIPTDPIEIGPCDEPGLKIVTRVGVFDFPDVLLRIGVYRLVIDCVVTRSVLTSTDLAVEDLVAELSPRV